MRDLTDFEKWQIVGASMAGASISQTVEFSGFSKTSISRTMTEFTKRGNTISNRSNSGRKSKLTERGRRFLERTIARNDRTTDTKVTAE